MTTLSDIVFAGTERERERERGGERERESVLTHLFVASQNDRMGSKIEKCILYI